MKNRISIAVMTTGFSGIVAQLLLLRELLIVFAGNELSIGVVLANWLILEAFGCYFVGKKAENARNKIAAFIGITILFSLSLPVMIHVTRILRTILDLSIGEGVGILPILYSSFIILMPVSLLHGALFTFGCKVYSTFSEPGATSISKVYIYETIGTIAGGLVWTYLLIPNFHAFQIALGLASINFLVCFVLLLPLWQRTKLLQRVFTIITLLMTLIGLLMIFTRGSDKLHYSSISAQWKGQNIVHYQNSIYGNITVMEIDDQYTFFLDGIPHIITPVPDIVFVEEFVHLPLLSHPYPEEMLILSGGAGGVINEILKHPTINKVEYTELDPLVLELLEKYPTTLTDNELTDNRVEIKHIDGRLFLKITEKKYDVILIGLTEPSDLQSNRFFTKEFFSLAEKKLNKPGIIAISLPGSLTYLNEELKDLNSCLYHTMKSAFSYVRVIPGEGTNLFLASNTSEITSVDISVFIRRLDERQLQTEIMIPWNIEHKLNPRWIDWFSEFIEDASQKINYDFKPIALFYNIAHWNALFSPELSGVFSWLEKLNLKIFLLLFLLFIALLLLLNAKNVRLFRSSILLCIGTTGFAGMMFDLVLIFAFQAIYGYVFSWIGLLITCFMAGSASGAMLLTYYMPRIKNHYKLFISTELIIIFFTLILPFIFLILQPFLDSPAVLNHLRIVFLPLSFISGLLVGIQFPLANKISLKENSNLSSTAGLIYSSDLLGGWLGGIVGSVILLPILGLLETCLVVVLLKLCGFFMLVVHSRKRG